MLASDTVLQNRYVIVRVIGQGGMGAVYEARDQRLASTVAVKETLCADPRLRQAFEHEARLLANLHHPALPVVSDHFIEGEGQFLVMQFIPGADLGARLLQQQQAFAPREVLAWADQLLAALEYLHGHQPPIVHRDIKPQNLKVTAQGAIVLLDFGLAKGALSQLSEYSLSQQSLYGYTPFYAPLEQMQGSGTDPRSDVYALGATLYCLLTNTAPVDALTRAIVRAKGDPDPLRPANACNPQVSARVAALLQEAMALDRAARPTATALRQALRDAVAALQAPTASTPPPLSEAPEGRRQWAMAAAAEWVRQGEAALAAEQWAAARAHYQAALALVPEHDAAQQGLARVQRAEALAEHYQAARAALSAERLDEAAQWLERIAREVPGYKDVAALQAEVAEGQAAAAQEQAVAWVVMQARTALAAGRAREAVTLLEMAVRQAPHAEAAHALLAEARTRAAQAPTEQRPVEKLAKPTEPRSSRAPPEAVNRGASHQVQPLDVPPHPPRRGAVGKGVRVALVLGLVALAIMSILVIRQSIGPSESAARFQEPGGVAMDSQGNIYVTEWRSNRVQKLSPTGVPLAQWGTQGSGPGQFNNLAAVAVDGQGNIYVADRDNHRIQKLSPTGQFLAQWGAEGSGPGQFRRPSGVAVDAQGNIYIADEDNHRIQKLSPTGQPLAQWGSEGSGVGQFDGPADIAVDGRGNIYVADAGNYRVQKLSPTGVLLAQWGSQGSGPGQFNAPNGVAVDSQGNIYVTDLDNNRLQKLSPTGVPLAQWGTQGSGPGQFNGQGGVAVDAQGNIYIADLDNNRLQKLSPTGVPLAQWGGG